MFCDNFNMRYLGAYLLLFLIFWKNNAIYESEAGSAKRKSPICFNKGLYLLHKPLKAE